MFFLKLLQSNGNNTNPKASFSFWSGAVFSARHKPPHSSGLRDKRPSVVEALAGAQCGGTGVGTEAPTRAGQQQTLLVHSTARLTGTYSKGCTGSRASQKGEKRQRGRRTGIDSPWMGKNASPSGCWSLPKPRESFRVSELCQKSNLGW